MRSKWLRLSCTSCNPHCALAQESVHRSDLTFISVEWIVTGGIVEQLKTLLVEVTLRVLVLYWLVSSKFSSSLKLKENQFI